MIPESPLLGDLEELPTCWYRPARDHLSDEDKESLCYGDFYFGCKDMGQWGIMLAKTLSYFEKEYGKAQCILTTINDSPKYILFENHKYSLGMKPTYRLRDMGAGSLPRKVDPDLVCSQTFNDGSPCTRKAWHHTGMCKHHTNKEKSL